MSTLAGTMTMPGFFPVSKEKEKVFEYVPSDSKNYEPEKLSDSLNNIKEYFPNFNFDISRVDNNIKDFHSQKLSETAIASFLSQKGVLFKSKFSGFNPVSLFYNVDTKGNKTSKTMEESIEYLRRLVKMEVVKRQNSKKHASEEIDINDLVNFVQSNFITHYIYLLEKSFNLIKSELTHLYSGFLTKTQEQSANKKHGINKNFNIPQEQFNYLRETISGILNYSRRTIENYEAKMKYELFGEEFFSKPQEKIEPRMIKKPYIEREIKAETLTDKVKGLFNNIFSKK